MTLALNALTCCLLAGLRLGGVKRPAFQAVAHLYVGGLFTYGWHLLPEVKIYFVLAWALSLVELTKFFIDKGLIRRNIVKRLAVLIAVSLPAASFGQDATARAAQAIAAASRTTCPHGVDCPCGSSCACGETCQCVTSANPLAPFVVEGVLSIIKPTLNGNCSVEFTDGRRFFVNSTAPVTYGGTAVPWQRFGGGENYYPGSTIRLSLSPQHFMAAVKVELNYKSLAQANPPALLPVSSQSRSFVSTGQGYKSVEGVLNRVEWAPTRGSNVVAITIIRNDDNSCWTYFFPYKPDALLINGIVQEGTESSALVNKPAGLTCKLYLDPVKGDEVAGVELGGHTPTFNYLSQQPPRAVQQQAQPTYSAPPVYYLPQTMMGGFGGAMCVGSS
jgi:hypothetical protein